jgi:hypothetical protein
MQYNLIFRLHTIILYFRSNVKIIHLCCVYMFVNVLLNNYVKYHNLVDPHFMWRLGIFSSFKSYFKLFLLKVISLFLYPTNFDLFALINILNRKKRVQ